MMTDFFNMPAQYVSYIYATLALGLTVAIYFAFRFEINLWWMNCWYGVPFAGKMARLSRDTTHSSKAGWLRAEETLCADYRKFVLATSESEFRKRLTYMSKAEDLGRHPLPGWTIAILVILLIAEGLGFSYLLGTWMARDGSANVHTVLMLAIVFVLCVIMLFVTHAAGHQLYRTGLIRRCDKEWRDDGQQGTFRTTPVKLDEDQTIDDKYAPYTQVMNRVGSSGGYAMVVIAVVAIAAIAVLSTWMRVNNLNHEIINSTVTGAAAASNGNPFASGLGLPSELTKPQQDADSNARAEALSSERSEGMAAFVMLAIIFIVTQIVSIYTGYKYGFAGKESRDAYRGTRGFAVYDDYVDRSESIIQLAQAQLQTLQRNLAAQSGNIRLQLTKTFDDFLRESVSQRQIRRAYGSQPPLHSQGSPAISTISQAMDRLALIDSAESKREFVTSLPVDLKLQVIERVKADKARTEEARRQTADKDLLSLF
jgi:hypothetical protein